MDPKKVFRLVDGDRVPIRIGQPVAQRWVLKQGVKVQGVRRRRRVRVFNYLKFRRSCTINAQLQRYSDLIKYRRPITISLASTLNFALRMFCAVWTIVWILKGTLMGLLALCSRSVMTSCATKAAATG